LNTLLTAHYIPMTALVKINAEFSALVEIALKTKLKQFHGALAENGLEDSVIESVLSHLKSCDEYVGSTFSLFSSAKLIEKYLQENFDYIPPTKITLGSGSFQFIPPSKILKKILSDQTYQKMQKKKNTQSAEESDTDSFLIEDISDGLLFKNNTYHISNPDALRKFLDLPISSTGSNQFCGPSSF